MNDNEDRPEKSASDDTRDLLNAHKLLRDDHRKQVAGYRAGNLHTFRDGREIPVVQAALEHEQQAAQSDEIIRDLKSSLRQSRDLSLAASAS